MDAAIKISNSKNVFNTYQRLEETDSGITFFNDVKSKIGLPCVIKSANQGSSIGVSVLNEDNQKLFD